MCPSYPEIKLPLPAGGTVLGQGKQTFWPPMNLKLKVSRQEQPEEPPGSSSQRDSY